MPNLRHLAFASFIAASSLGAAESPEVQLPAICTEAHVFGSKFGTTEVQGKTLSSGLNSVVVELAEQWGPFKVVEIGVTRRSKRIWSGSAIATLADQQQASELLLGLRSKLEQTLQISAQQIDRLGRVTLYTGSQYSSPSGQGEARYHIDGLKIELSVSKASLFVGCTDLKREIEHVREALGK